MGSSLKAPLKVLDKDYNFITDSERSKLVDALEAGQVLHFPELALTCSLKKKVFSGRSWWIPSAKTSVSM